MNSIIEFFNQLLNAEQLIYTGGLVLILIVVFVENGVFFGFFLPGDTLLITTGLFCATDKLHVPLSILLITICLSAIFGSLFGYYFGKKVGASLFHRKDSLLFKRKYIIAAEMFFLRYGGLALIIGRFLPILRTFAPIFAGIVKFNFKKFLTFNVAGAILWAFSMILGGYFLGKYFPNAEENLEYIIISIVIITWIPVVRTYLKERKNLAKKPE